MREEPSSADRCPTADRWLKLLDDCVSDDERTCLEHHLDDCGSCRGTLDELATDPDSWPQLLDAVRQVASSTLAGNEAETVVAAPAPSWQLEGYHVLEEIGRGGAGTIHRAVDVRLRRQVAVKVLQSTSLEHSVRFRNEAAAAAQLQHPNIIEVFATGIQQQRAYLVMELIDEGDLGRYLSGRPVEPREAAQLVATLARAIEAAHEAGILHRDLKPANILLQSVQPTAPSNEAPSNTTGQRRPSRTDQDSLGQYRPKITDFGLAFWTDSESGPTQTGEFLGTPSYMPPEQALASSDWATPHVDIYALGAILYECLTGRAPFQADSTAATVDLLLHTEPVSPRRLNPRIPRDLETICLHCLEKQPERRYVRAGALAADLEAYLNGETISARPTPPWEQAFRWSQRNVTSSVLLGVLLLSFLSLLGVWGWFTRQLQAKTRLAVENAEATQRTLDEVQASNEATREVLRFITDDFFGAAAPEQAGIDLTVIEVLEQIDSRVAERFEGRPKVEAPMRVVVGDLWRNLGQPRRAIEHLARGVTLYDQAAGPRNDDAVFEAKHAYVNCLLDLDRPDEARPLMEELLSFEDELPDRKRLSLYMTNGELVLHDSGGQAAVDYLTEVHAECLRLLGEHDSTTLNALGNLGVVCLRAGQADRAMELFRQQWQALQETAGPDDVTALAAADNFATMLVQVGEYDDAEEIHRDTLERRTRILGPHHFWTINSHRSLVMLYWRQGKRGDAIDGMEGVVAEQSKSLGPAHEGTIATLFQLSEMYLRTNEFPRGAAFLQRHVGPIVEQQLLITDFESLVINYGKLLLAVGDRQQAEHAQNCAARLLEESGHTSPQRKLEELRKAIAEQPPSPE